MKSSDMKIVAKEIADKVKELEDDEARLPRCLTFHLSLESQRQVAAQDSMANPQVRCTHNECSQIADYECQVCHEHALCRKWYRQNATELPKEYRTIRPCTYCKKNAHTQSACEMYKWVQTTVWLVTLAVGWN